MKYTITKENANNLANWYLKNKRQLPWRDTNNPYDVWISEIMLQQTRIEAVKPKYEKFKNELPDITALANCDDDHLMYLWEGLGYYSRARNLKKCAIVLVNEYNAKLPQDYKTLLKLPGIGPYTAGAIASIAYGIPAPAVDGNVMRVVARLLEIRKDVRDANFRKEIEEAIMQVFSNTNDKSRLNGIRRSYLYSKRTNQMQHLPMERNLLCS